MSVDGDVLGILVIGDGYSDLLGSAICWVYWDGYDGYNDNVIPAGRFAFPCCPCARG